VAISLPAIYTDRADGSLSPKLVPTFGARECCVVSTKYLYGRILGFLDPSRYFFFQAAPQLYSRGWVDPAPDPLLLRKSGSVGNRNRDLWICSQELWPLDHRGGSNTGITGTKPLEAWRLSAFQLPALSCVDSGFANVQRAQPTVYKILYNRKKRYSPRSDISFAVKCSILLQ
jgi:hypothetical protein